MNDKLQQPVVVVGLGATGLSVARFLAARGESFSVVDSRDAPPGLEAMQRELPQVAVTTGGWASEQLTAAATLIVSPGIRSDHPDMEAVIASGGEVIGDIELFARHVDAPVLAVTGSNGKSTVSALLAEMARCSGYRVALGGNYGPPALDLLGCGADLYVLELSSFQLETTGSLDATAATVLNLSPDHLDRYHSLADYAASKQRIFRGSGRMVLNADDELVMAMRRSGRVTVSFSLGEPVGGGFGVIEVGGEKWLAHGNEPILAANEVAIGGLHNRANALAALALASACEMPLDALQRALRGFAGLPHRSQFVASIDAVCWYNDSKGTNVGATLAALNGTPGERIVLIAGGEGKGQEFSPLRAAMLRRGRGAVLIGRDAAQIETALAAAVEIVHADSMETAVAAARRLAQPGDAVLLSPACASFDQFRDYVERGESFMRAVNSLGATAEVAHGG